MLVAPQLKAVDLAPDLLRKFYVQLIKQELVLLMEVIKLTTNFTDVSVHFVSLVLPNNFYTGSRTVFEKRVSFREPQAWVLGCVNGRALLLAHPEPRYYSLFL